MNPIVKRAFKGVLSKLKLHAIKLSHIKDEASLKRIIPFN